VVEEALAYDPANMRARRMLAILKGELKPDEIIDPDRIAPPVPGDAEKSNAQRFTCPQCGGRMAYAPDGKSLTCEYCESRQSLARSSTQANAQEAENFLIAMATRKGHLHPTSRQTFFCQGCGVDFLLPPQHLTLTCPYCGSAYVVRRPESRDLIDPQRIIPFQVDENAARQALRDWFAQDSPGAGLRTEKGTALYLPVWSFEVAGQVPWNCLVQEGRNRWVVEKGNEIVYHAAVVVPASQRLSTECAAELKTFDVRQAVPFDERYLANWPAETYQVNVGDASLEARHWVYEFEQRQVRERLLRPVKDLSFNSLGITIESFALVLLPLWVSHYRVEDKRYEVVINGQTGAVGGQRPSKGLSGMLGKLFRES
jgi:predicted RNA-binding Zn-ribbon protein involved in translation (DUF1610 family)